MEVLLAHLWGIHRGLALKVEGLARVSNNAERRPQVVTVALMEDL